MTPAEVAARIGQGRERKSGNGWMMPCPAHDDSTASCSVSEGDDGRTLVKCFAGCDTEVVIAERDMTMADLFRERQADDRPRIASTYPYVDESGSPLFEVVRFEPKDFRQRTPDGNGGWHWKLNGARRVPYRLPELLAAAKAGGFAYVTEGEKDADAVVRAGAFATCAAGGAGKWRPEYAEHFAGLDEVIVVADRDLPGYRHAREVARSLSAVVPSVLVCEARHGKDVSDHLAAELPLDDLALLTDDELEQLCADPEVAVEKSVAIAPPLPAHIPAMFRRYTMPEVLAEPDHFAWLVTGLLADPTYGQVAGEMKTLKSTILAFISVGLSGGVPIFGRFAPVAQRPVVAYVGEGGRRLWTRRIRRICSAMGVNPGDLDLHPVFDVAPIGSSIFQESFQRDLDEIEPGLITLDPYYTYHGAVTRASDLHQEGALLNQLSKPCMDVGCSLKVVNHMNQTGSGMSLKRITMAGSGEWADSWLLVAHREDPDVGAGLFRLNLEIGSRQWGGTSWDLDLDIGRFDEETGSHDGEMSWDLRRASSGASSKKDAGAERSDKTRMRILDALTDGPWTMTKTDLRTVVAGNRDLFDSTFGALADEGVIAHDMVGRPEAGTTKKRLLWGLAPTRTITPGPGWSGDVE